MSFVHQSVWGWPIAAYLFLGGLGGGAAALAYWFALQLGPTAPAGRSLLRFGMAAGLFCLILGTALLVYDLGDPAHLWHILGNPRAWIFWGVLIITVFMLAAFGYLLPEYGPQRGPGAALVRRLQPAQGGLALTAAVSGVLVALYTGFLVSMAPAIPFWNTPALPLLFLVSALSTASALLMLQGIGRAAGHALLSRLEATDVWLIGTELLILGAFLNYGRMAAEAARLSRAQLLHSPGFLVGFVVLGLLVPWALEIGMVRRRRGGGEPGPHGPWARATGAAAAVLVLGGGFLLRWYVLAAGIFGYPFPRV